MKYLENYEDLAGVLHKAWNKRADYVDSGRLEAFRLITKEELGIPLAVDIYGYGNKPCAVMQQYDFDISEKELELLEEVLRAEFHVAEFFYKRRFRVKESPESGGEISGKPVEIVVQEYGHKFLVNLNNYLDTGLFLDHRDTRKWVEEMVRGAQSAKRKAQSLAEEVQSEKRGVNSVAEEAISGKRGVNSDGGYQVLNLFAYTGSFSVYAAAGGATMTHTVDLSKTYCDWARRNMEMNGFAKEQHWIYRMDTFEFYRYAARKGLRFDLIILDPPTFSRNKGENFSVQRDHYELVMSAIDLMKDDGELIFSNNCLDFVLDWRIKRDFEVRNVQNLTVPIDFRVDTAAEEDDLYRQIHNCYLISRKSS